MFTGLIQTLGTIKPLGGDSWQITCIGDGSRLIMEDLAYGDSVAVDGVCLTVEQKLKDGFVATASPETLRRTTLGQASTGNKYVNLETSLRVGGKVGGHFVMGHVDGMGQMVATVQTATSWELEFTAPDAIARYIVPKGSIAINGISLTVADYSPDLCQFKVAIIPLTYADTNLRYLIPGSWVNLEGDILGKYVEKFLNFGDSAMKAGANNDEHHITSGFLAEHGYL
ncbi:MAG: riboflavin synthase [Calothrix sp. MO_167.B12]|nr:riboflavin synthase [Calothrix sp. MO_167.B12]